MSRSRVRTHKLVLLGDPTVGKTSLRKRYLGEGFETNYAMTIGADFGVKRLVSEDQVYLFQIWDLSGQISFHHVRRMYYNNVTTVLIVFDLAKPETLENVKGWFDEYKNNVPIPKANCVLLGNKNDLVSTLDEELTAKIKECQTYISNIIKSEVGFFSTSALSGDNVTEAFQWVIDRILDVSGDITAKI